MKTRPVNLDLSTLKFPPMAIASILHRLSGVVLFLLLPVMLCFLGCSLHSEESYQKLLTLFANPYIKIILWGFSSALWYHLIAGVRHLLMDLGFGESLSCGKRSAILIIILAIIGALILGVWIW